MHILVSFNSIQLNSSNSRSNELCLVSSLVSGFWFGMEYTNANVNISSGYKSQEQKKKEI